MYMHPSIDILFSLVFFVALLGIVVAVILFFKSREGVFPARLLSGYLFCVSIILLFSAAYHTDLFLRFPHLARSMVFLSMCSSPFAYLYVRAVLRQEYGFRRSDALLFVPGLLYTMNMIPFYLMPADEKRAFMERVLADRSLIALEPEGVLPDGWGILIRMAYGLMLAALQLTLVLKWRDRILNATERVSQNVGTFKWLFFFSFLVSLSFLLLMVEYVFQVSQFLEVYRLITMTMCASILSTCTYLLFRPNILYGMSGWLQKDFHDGPSGQETFIEGEPAVRKRQTLTPVQEKSYKKLLEDHFSVNSPFLKQGYRLSDLSAEIDVPVYQLSAFINQEYGKNFNELVNEYRVGYVKKLLDANSEYRQYTLEAIGRMAGFNSRTTFIAAVKKVSGMTPVEYLGQGS
jgi:AraC-like DNA-binding protein